MQRSHPVSLAEGIPGQAYRQGPPMGEQGTTNDEIGWAMELEQEESAGWERLELHSPAGLPEVDLVESWARGEEAIPLFIGHTHEEAHQYQITPVGRGPKPSCAPP